MLKTAVLAAQHALQARLASQEAARATIHIMTATEISQMAVNQKLRAPARQVRNAHAGSESRKTGTLASAKTANRYAMRQVSSGAHARAAFIPLL